MKEEEEGEEEREEAEGDERRIEGVNKQGGKQWRATPSSAKEESSLVKRE